MPKREIADSEQVLTMSMADPRRAIEITDALPVRLQTLDVARHVAIAPNGKRYVVATFDDTHLGRNYVTAVYPQQDGYLTLVLLVVYQIVSKTHEQAVQQHITLVQTIQQGKLNQFLKTHQSSVSKRY